MLLILKQSIVNYGFLQRKSALKYCKLRHIFLKNNQAHEAKIQAHEANYCEFCDEVF